MTHPFKPGDLVDVYLRDSGGDEQELSVPQQEKVAREFCAAEGLIVVRVFKDEARSGGSTTGREAFDEMLAHFLKEKAPEAGLILWSFARFARNDIDAQIYKNQLRKEGYKIHSLSDKIPEGIHGRLIEYVIDYSNTLFLQNLSKEVKRGQRHLVEEFGGVPGTPPRGFKRERMELGKRRNGQVHVAHRWVPRHDDEWNRCRQAWELRAKGASLDEIRQQTHLYKATNSYHRFFRNKIYLGILEFGPLTIQDYCEPLISQATWDLVQDVNAQHEMTNNFKDSEAVNHPNRKRSAYLLTGLVRCGVCGAAVNGNTAKLRGRPNYTYYFCARAKRRKDCPNLRIPREGLEQVVLDALLAHVLQPETLTELQEEALAMQAEQAQYGLSELETLRKQLRATQGQVDRVVEAISRLTLTEPLEQKYRALELERLDLQVRITNLEKQAANAPTPQTFKELDTLAAQLREILSGDDLQLQREILQSFVHQITVTRTGQDVQVYLDYVSPALNTKSPDEGQAIYAPRSAPKGTAGRDIKRLEINFQVRKRGRR